MENTEKQKAPILNIKIEEEHSGISLIDFLGTHNDHFPSRKSAKKSIEKGLVHINRSRAKTNHILKTRDVLEIYPDEQKNRPEIELKINILFEDNYLAVVNKPSGIQVSGNTKRTLENALSGNLTLSTEKDALKFPEAIHRLDFQTTGIVLIGKTAEAVRLLNKLFEDRKVEKEYSAICIGEIPESGRIDKAIDGKNAITEFKRINQWESKKYKFLNLVELKIETGRRHQIRKHMFSLGFPVLGDPDYGFPGMMPKGRGMFLHASKISFEHPFTKKILDIKSDLPSKFRKVFTQG